MSGASSPPSSARDAALEPLVELLERELPLGGRAAQLLCDALAVCVGGAEIRKRVAHLPRGDYRR